MNCPCKKLALRQDASQETIRSDHSHEFPTLIYYGGKNELSTSGN